MVEKLFWCFTLFTNRSIDFTVKNRLSPIPAHYLWIQPRPGFEALVEALQDLEALDSDPPLVLQRRDLQNRRSPISYGKSETRTDFPTCMLAIQNVPLPMG
jgi:hypothetical protein